eukprot:13809-Heterococcus_DN1.PRE.1
MSKQAGNDARVYDACCMVKQHSLAVIAILSSWSTDKRMRCLLSSRRDAYDAWSVLQCAPIVSCAGIA